MSVVRSVALAAAALSAVACGSVNQPHQPVGVGATAATGVPPPAPGRASAAPSTPEPATDPAASVDPLDAELARIWTELPDDFAVPVAAATPDADATAGASRSFEVGALVEPVAVAMQGALERADYSTESMSGPFEDGTVVIVSVGPTSTDCRVETTIEPTGASSRITMTFGAACPVR